MMYIVYSFNISYFPFIRKKKNWFRNLHYSETKIHVQNKKKKDNQQNYSNIEILNNKKNKSNSIYYATIFELIKNFQNNNHNSSVILKPPKEDDEIPIFHKNIQNNSNFFYPDDVIKEHLNRAQNFLYYNWFTQLLSNKADFESKISTKNYKLNKPRSPLEGVPFTFRDVYGIEHNINNTRYFTVETMIEKLYQTSSLVNIKHVRTLLDVGGICIGKTCYSIPNYILRRPYHPSSLYYSFMKEEIPASFSSPSLSKSFSFLSILEGGNCPRNPYNIHKTAGGGCTGAAGSIAAGIATFALGNDGPHDSVRIPSALCGVFGFKPDSTLPGFTEGDESTGIITRSILDCAIILDILINGYCESMRISQYSKLSLTNQLKNIKKKPKFKIAFASLSKKVSFFKIDEDITSIMYQTLNFLKKEGWEIQEVDISHFLFDAIHEELYSVKRLLKFAFSHEMTYLFKGENRFKYSNDWLDPDMIEYLLNPSFLEPEEKIWKTIQLKKSLNFKIKKFFEDYDILLTPTITTIAWDAGKLKPDHYDDYISSNIFTLPFSWSGNAAASIPIGLVNGLPVGMQIISKKYELNPWLGCNRVLQICYALEKLGLYNRRTYPNLLSIKKMFK